MASRKQYLRTRPAAGPILTKSRSRGYSSPKVMSMGKPIRLIGSRDGMADLPPAWKDPFTALAGKIDWKVSWDLRKKKKD